MTTATATRAPAPARRAAGGSALTGTGTLLRFILRRDRIRLPAWVGGITLATVGSVASLPDIYADPADRQARAELMANPGTRAVSGPGYGLDDYTFGAMIANEYLSWVVVFVALMSVLLMVRHTRAEEESGRAELVRATVVGRHAGTVAALIAVGGANLLLGVLTAAGVAGLGLDSVDWASSWLFGASLAAVGLVFAGVAAVTAQLSEYARGAGGLAGGMIGVAYLLRAAGDMGDGTLSWLSPIGWSQATKVYVEDRWWPLLIPVAVTAVLVVAAFVLSSRRDVGAGMIRPRSGRAAASAVLTSPFGLAVRLQRSALLWWSAALFLFALGYGTLAGEVESFVEDLSAVQDWIDTVGGDSIINSFLALIMSMWALAVAVYAVLAVLRLRSEETDGRAEPILSTAVSRTRWVASHLIVALAGSAILLLLSGLGLGLTASAALGDGSVLTDLLGAALVYLPAVWLVIGAGVALYGLAPRAVALVWAVVVYALVVGMFGGLFQFPDWMFNLSPFGHVPQVPADDVRWTPLVLLTAIAVALVAAGLAGFRRRDLESK